MLISLGAGQRLLTDGRIVDESPKFVPSWCAQPPVTTWHYFDAAGACTPSPAPRIDNCAAAAQPFTVTYQMVNL